MPRSRHHNLSNKDSEPAKAAIECRVEIHFGPYVGKFPKRKFQDWLESIPEEAKIHFAGTASGKAHFVASWVEERG